MTRSSLSVESPPYLSASVLNKNLVNSITAKAVRSCGLLNINSSRFRDFLGSKSIVVFKVGYADYINSKIIVQENVAIENIMFCKKDQALYVLI